MTPFISPSQTDFDGAFHRVRNISEQRREQMAELFIDFLGAADGVGDLRPQQFTLAPPQPMHRHLNCARAHPQRPGRIGV